MSNVLNITDGSPIESTSFSSPLSHGGGGGTFGGMTEVDAKIAAAEARTDTKFAQLDGKFAQIDVKFAQIDTKFAQVLGEIGAVNTRLSHVEASLSGMRLNIWLAAATAVGLTAAIVGYGATAFGDGLSSATIVDAAVNRVTAQTGDRMSTLETQLANQAKQLDAIAAAVSRTPAQSANPPQQ